MHVSVERSDTWVELTEDVLDVGRVHDWCVRPHCGAVVVFSGTVRDHAEHRTGVTRLDYEAYEAQVVPRLERIAADMRQRWPDLGRVCLRHRIGSLELGEVSVVVGVSSPHRGQAFEAAQHGIDTLKATVPIWKREHWEGGTDWGLASQEVRDVDVAADAPGAPDGA